MNFLSDAIEMSKDLIAFLGKKFKSKDTFYLWMPFRTIFVSCDADVVQHILMTNHKNYRKDYSYNKLKMALGNGLLTNEGESWFKQRRLAQPAFYKTRLEGFFDVMNLISKEHIISWNRNDDLELFIDKEMMQLTSKIVVETLLGSDVSDKLTQIQKHIYDIQNYLVQSIRFPWYEWYAGITGKKNKFNSTIASFDKILYEIINTRKTQSSKNDLLSMLMDARDADTQEGMSDKQLRDELITIYVAGHETSGYAISWAMYCLCSNPEKMYKVKEELNKVMPDGKLTIENYKQLIYLKAVIDEALRLYPTAYLLSRESKAAAFVNTTKIPEKTVTLLSIYHLHRHPKYWENPDAFIPERFEGKNNVLFNSNAYYPFGAGPRMCIGFHFAIMEITIVMANLLFQNEFELDKNHPIEFEPLVTLKPKYGIKLKLKKKL